MKFVVTLLEDGRQIAGDIGVPSVPPGPYRASAIARLEQTMQKMLRDPRQSGSPVRQRIAALVPVLAAQLEPELPPAAPARTEMEHDAAGRTVRQVTYKATPAPSIRAREIARRLAPYLACEQLVVEMAAADRSRQQEQARKTERRLIAAANDVLDRQRSGPRSP